jgi:hypothetical protein
MLCRACLQMISRHSLSRGALLADGAPPIFVLDAWIIIMVRRWRRRMVLGCMVECVLQPLP